MNITMDRAMRVNRSVYPDRFGMNEVDYLDFERLGFIRFDEHDYVYPTEKLTELAIYTSSKTMFRKFFNGLRRYNKDALVAMIAEQEAEEDKMFW